MSKEDGKTSALFGSHKKIILEQATCFVIGKYLVDPPMAFQSGVEKISIHYIVY